MQINGYMTKFDLKSGYHHIEVVHTQHKLLGFSYDDYEGNVRYFQFKVLPFGLATAGLIFTKVLKQLIKHWRTKLIKVVVFLDDGLQTDLEYEKAKQNALIIKGGLITAGWIPHRKKSCWEPAQIVEWLGFLFNLIKGIVLCTTEKIERTIKVIDHMLELKKYM